MYSPRAQQGRRLSQRALPPGNDSVETRYRTTLGPVTGFFVPGVEPDRAEARWLELAEVVAAPAVGPADRVRSVRFAAGAEEWTAEVGEPLSGQLAARTDRRPARRGAPSRSAPTRRVTDTATVLAVFDTGDAYVVVTDAHPVGEVRDSTWDNPTSIARRAAREVLRFGR
jgi:hypothetical protein